MTVEEFDNQFDVLYNNITSNQAPGLNTYEKSVFLTKAQDEILKNYFNPKGNKYQEGFDGNQKRQIDFSMITKVATAVNKKVQATAVPDDIIPNKDGDGNQLYTLAVVNDTTRVLYKQAYDATGNPIPNKYVAVNSPTQTFDDAVYDPRPNSVSIELPARVMMIINERVTVTRSNQEVFLAVVPLTFDEYNRLMSKPYKRPLKYQAWRLINSDTQGKVDLIVGPNDVVTNYTMRYIRRPNPIVLGDLDGLNIDGCGSTTECELDPILHEEILQRAVELAKVAWTNTGQENIQSVLEAGKRSE